MATTTAAPGPGASPGRPVPEGAAPATGSPLTHRQILVVLSGLMLGMLLAALDQTIVATSLPTIVGELGGLDHLSWVITAYLLTSTATTPLYGKLSDLYGRKLLFQVAIVVFLAGSMLAGLSQTMAQLVAFRALQGAGAGGLMALSMAIIGDIVSPRQRGRYQGYLGGVFALASIGGPLIGGFFVDHLSWRWVFYINLPLGLAALFVTATVLNLPFRRVPHRVDWLGSGLLVGAVTSLLLVTVWGGSEYEWTSPLIVGLLVAGLAATALFVAQERRAVEPVLPLRLFRNSVFSVTSAAAFVMGVLMFGAIIFIPMFLQVVGGASATSSGLLLTPMMLGVIATSVLVGRLVTRTGRYKIFPLLGTAMATGGVVLLATMDSSTRFAEAALYMAVVGVGLGATMQVFIVAVQNAVEHRDLGVASSSSMFFRSMGGSFGVALFGAVFASRLGSELTRLVPTGVALDPGTLRSSPEQIRALPEPVRSAVVESFSGAIHGVFLWAVPVGVAAFLLVLFLRELPLRDSAFVGGAAAAEAVAVPVEVVEGLAETPAPPPD